MELKIENKIIVILTNGEIILVRLYSLGKLQKLIWTEWNDLDAEEKAGKTD